MGLREENLARTIHDGTAPSGLAFKYRRPNALTLFGILEGLPTLTEKSENTVVMNGAAYVDWDKIKASAEYQRDVLSRFVLSPNIKDEAAADYVPYAELEQGDVKYMCACVESLAGISGERAQEARTFRVEPEPATSPAD